MGACPVCLGPVGGACGSDRPSAWYGYSGQERYGALGACFFFFQAEDGIRDLIVTGVQTCALPIYNPTGTPLPDGAVQRLLAETTALIVLDEAYQDFGGPTAVSLLKHEPRLVVLRTFSKAMSLAGLRFGYALAHPAVAAEIAKARLPYNVNRVTLAAAHAALDAADVLAERVGVVRRNRDALAGRLARIPGLRAFPSAANFVLIRCDTRPAGEVFRRLVEEHGILVRDVSGAAGLEGCLRITAGTDEDVDAVVRALQAILV